MIRKLATGFLALLVAACASLPPPRAAASARAVPFSDELECVADCLDDGEPCEACVDRCLRPEPGSVVASSR